MSRDPNDHGAETLLPVLAVGYEPSCVDGGVTDLPLFQNVPDPGVDSVPDGAERRVEDSVDGLGRAARGTGEGSVKII